jgi:probable rRNA maturation factor
MRIRVSEGSEDWADDTLLALLEKAGTAVLAHEGVDQHNIEIDLTFVTEEEIKEINREHRGRDNVTDVLSFPMFSDKGDVDFAVKHGMEEIILGDVVICLPVLKGQAEEFGHSEERETAYLFVHSVLHLLGYDHEDVDPSEMREAEEEIMKELGLERK